MITKSQMIVLGLALVFFLALYSCPTRPPDRKQIDRDRQEEAVAINTDKLLLRAKEIYSQEQLSSVLGLEQGLNPMLSPTEEVEILKNISSQWNMLGDFALGGVYAERVANVVATDSAYSIAGTTYFSCFQRDKDSLVQKFCFDKAIQSFESAISIAPDNPVHNVNLGLCYVESGSQPMKGIMVIRDVAEKFPENALASITLGRLSLRTGQYDKAIQRLENALKHEPQNPDAHYWLGLTYQSMNNLPKAKSYLNTFLSLSDDSPKKEQVKAILKQIGG